MHSRELLSVPTLRVDCVCCIHVCTVCVTCILYLCVCVYQSELLLDIIHALVFVYLSESLLGGSPPLSMYALEGAVECPHTQG